jgi:hypothetical protein
MGPGGLGTAWKAGDRGAERGLGRRRVGVARLPPLPVQTAGKTSTHCSLHCSARVAGTGGANPKKGGRYLWPARWSPPYGGIYQARQPPTFPVPLRRANSAWLTLSLDKRLRPLPCSSPLPHFYLQMKLMEDT